MTCSRKTTIYLSIQNNRMLITIFNHNRIGKACIRQNVIFPFKELLKKHLKNKNISILWPQIRICDHRFESVGIDLNLEPQIQTNLWPHIRICGNRFESVGADCNLWPQIVTVGRSY